MGATLTVASEKQAYTITDRATYLARQSTLDLDLLVEGDPILLNVYHVIVVNPDKSPQINVDGAVAFADFMVDPNTQEIIGEFGVESSVSRCSSRMPIRLTLTWVCPQLCLLPRHLRQPPQLRQVNLKLF
jgi:hypothetical protein